jgi:hypothetical protein
MIMKQQHWFLGVEHVLTDFLILIKKEDEGNDSVNQSSPAMATFAASKSKRRSRHFEP